MNSIFDINEKGVVAKLFLPNTNEPRPAVIVLSGSYGGFYEPLARVLAHEGYVALALAYFNAPGLPKDLEAIPLEYFLNAIRWLKARSEVADEKVSFYGISRGAELAILIASVFPQEITSIIAVAPSCVTNSAIPDITQSAWTFGKKPFPIAPPPSRQDVFEQLKKQPFVNLTQLFLEKIHSKKEEFEAAMINVENINCPILLISGKDDQMWPSAMYADMLMQRLDTFKSKIVRKHLCYDGAGHMILHPHAPIMTTAQKNPITGLCYEVGGDPVAQAAANKDSWNEILKFLSC